MKKNCIKLASLILVVISIFSLAIPAFAASGVKDLPYGYNWLDESNPDNVWYFQYYSKANSNVYSVVDYTYLIGNDLYDKNGKVISNSVLAMDKDPSLDVTPTVAYANGGTLYFLTTSGEICKMTNSTSETYSKCTITVKSKNFELDADGLGIKIDSKELNSLTFSGSYSRNGEPSDEPETDEKPNKSGNYVLTRAASGDPLKVCYDAYKDDKLIITVSCKNANVWVETEQILLSETCVGAKFVGYSTNYHTILYDLDGTIYAFAYGDYERALPISLGEEIKSYKKDSNGFIKSITTSENTYDLNELLSEYEEDEETEEDTLQEEIKYVKNRLRKSTAYSANKESLFELKKSKNYLYFNGEKLDNSKKPTYIGFTKSGCAVWINRSGNMYCFNPADNSITCVKEKSTRLRYDKNGFAYQYTVGWRSYPIDF